MLSSDWLMKGVFFFTNSSFFPAFPNKINHGFALTYNTLKKNNANEFEIYTFQRFQT
jgi:hypothetical protein